MQQPLKVLSLTLAPSSWRQVASDAIRQIKMSATSCLQLSIRNKDGECQNQYTKEHYGSHLRKRFY